MPGRARLTARVGADLPELRHGLATEEDGQTHHHVRGHYEGVGNSHADAQAVQTVAVDEKRQPPTVEAGAGVTGPGSGGSSTYVRRE